MNSGFRSLSVIFILVCAGMLIYQYFGNADLRAVLMKRRKLSTARIDHISQQGGKYKQSVCYTFQVEQQTYQDCRQYHLSGALEEKLVGVYVPVLYDSVNPSLNQILLYKGDYQTYKLGYPDSLHWIEDLR